MALAQKDRDKRRHDKAARLQEEDLRLKVRPGTKQALADLMEWSGLEEQGEALTLMIHHLHALGPGGALPLLEIPRHEINVSSVVALEFHRKSMLMLRLEPGDEILPPMNEGRPP